MAASGSSREVSAAGDAGSQERTTIAQDPLQNERYQFWGGSGSARENAAANGATSGADRNQRLSYDDSQLMTLNGQDRQKIAAMWAQANGADINDANAYTKTSLTDGGNTAAVGPFKLTAAMVMNDWANGMVNGEGLVDRGALDSYVQQGKISDQTAQMVSSPEFMEFMKKLSTGGQATPEEIQKYLPPDLQQAIAGDLINAGAAIVGMQGGKLSAGGVLDTVRGFDAQTGQMIDFGSSPYASDGIVVPRDSRTTSGGSSDSNYNNYGNVWQQDNAEGEQQGGYDPDPDHIADRIPVTSPTEWITGIEDGTQQDPSTVYGADSSPAPVNDSAE
jgi:hypothetical protein